MFSVILWSSAGNNIKLRCPKLHISFILALAGGYFQLNKPQPKSNKAKACAKVVYACHLHVCPHAHMFSQPQLLSLIKLQL